MVIYLQEKKFLLCHLKMIQLLDAKIVGHISIHLLDGWKMERGGFVHFVVILTIRRAITTQLLRKMDIELIMRRDLSLIVELLISLQIMNI